MYMCIYTIHVRIMLPECASLVALHGTRYCNMSVAVLLLVFVHVQGDVHVCRCVCVCVVCVGVEGDHL